MPTNLPPEYYEAENRYRAASTTQEKIASLEELLSTIPKHKGTDKLRADFRRRLSKLKSSAQSQKKVSHHASVFHIDREGAGQVVVIGPTNVGKSALVAALTNADPEVSPSPFTTWQPTPGMMPVNDVQVQLIDTPPLDRDYLEPELIQLIQRADLILLLLDLQADPLQQLEDSAATLRQHHIIPAHHKETHPAKRAYYIPLWVLVNKNDDETSDEDYEIFCHFLEGHWPLLPISTTTGRNLDRLKLTLFDELQIIRVYTKAPGKDPDYTAPFVLKKGSTVSDFARKVHNDFLHNLKAARVWGGADFDGQMVSKDYPLQDGDVVELRI